MSIYRQFETDTTAEKEGVWLEYPANDNETIPRFKVARSGGSNDPYLKTIEQRFKPYRSAIRNEVFARAKMETIVREVFAEKVVLAWENVQDRDGKVLPFTKENVIQVFKDLPELFKDIQEQSGNLALYRKDVQEADAKN